MYIIKLDDGLMAPAEDWRYVAPRGFTYKKAAARKFRSFKAAREFANDAYPFDIEELRVKIENA